MVKKLVKCTPEYWEFVRLLRSDPRVQEGFIEQVDITTEQQNRYMQKHADSYRVALLEETPVGFVGVIDDDIRICTHPDYQGKGIGQFMLKGILEEYPTAYGKVKIENKSSRNLFKSLGFQETFIIFTR
jgi:GNAT superfamily N-acetyltransferase